MRHLAAAYADPWVLEGLGGRDSLGRVHGQHLVDEVLRLLLLRCSLVKVIRLKLAKDSSNNSIQRLSQIVFVEKFSILLLD